MPFRDKVKRALGGRSPSSAQDSEFPPRRKDIDYYKPDKIPPSKYRGPWDQDHQDLLHAFSFGDATHEHRGSHQSICSPRGTLAQSRSPSWVDGEQAETEDDDTQSSEDGQSDSASRPVENAGRDRELRRSANLIRRISTGQSRFSPMGHIAREKSAESKLSS